MNITQLLDFTFEAREDCSFVTYQGKQLLSAETCGDGACSLHAIFGEPQYEKGPLMANNVRYILVDKLNMSLDMFLNNHPHISLNMMTQIFDVFWDELGIEVATKKILVVTSKNVPLRA